MFTIRQLLEPCTIRQLMAFADALDPNHSWDEWVESDSVTESEVSDAMAHAYAEREYLSWALSSPKVFAILKG